MEAPLLPPPHHSVLARDDDDVDDDDDEGRWNRRPRVTPPSNCHVSRAPELGTAGSGHICACSVYRVSRFLPDHFCRHICDMFHWPVGCYCPARYPDLPTSMSTKLGWYRDTLLVSLLRWLTGTHNMENQETIWIVVFKFKPGPRDGFVAGSQCEKLNIQMS